jgi:hypothetical protein
MTTAVAPRAPGTLDGIERRLDRLEQMLRKPAV